MVLCFAFFFSLKSELLVFEGKTCKLLPQWQHFVLFRARQGELLMKVKFWVVDNWNA